MPATARRRTRPGGENRSERAERTNLYDEVTGRIIADLEAGTMPWVQPWGRIGSGPALPANALSGRAYSGINILLLWGAAIAAAYPTQGWLTFRQALDAGGNVRKGERGTIVVYADRFVPKEEAERAAREGDEPGAVPFLKRFTVFNVAQCEGLRADAIAILQRRELLRVADTVSAEIDKPFREAEIGEHVAGRLQRKIDLVGGSAALVERAHDFTLVPWRPALDRHIGRTIDGVMRSEGTSWRLGRGRDGPVIT